MWHDSSVSWLDAVEEAWQYTTPNAFLKQK